MATKAVKISEEFIEVARAESKVVHRTVGAQIEYWARLGRELESSGALGPTDVRNLLAGRGNVQDLEGGDDRLYLDALTKELESLDGSDRRIVDDLREGGYPIASTNDEGELVIEKSDHRSKTSSGRNDR